MCVRIAELLTAKSRRVPHGCPGKIWPGLMKADVAKGGPHKPGWRLNESGSSWHLCCIDTYPPNLPSGTERSPAEKSFRRQRTIPSTMPSFHRVVGDEGSLSDRG